MQTHHHNKIPLRSALRRLPSLSVVQQVTDLIGRRCKINNTNMHGVIDSVNHSPYGAFPGSRYPVNVKLDSDMHGYTNKIHAYRIDDVELD